MVLGVRPESRKSRRVSDTRHAAKIPSDRGPIEKGSGIRSPTFLMAWGIVNWALSDFNWSIGQLKIKEWNMKEGKKGIGWKDTRGWSAGRVVERCFFILRSLQTSWITRPGLQLPLFFAASNLETGLPANHTQPISDYELTSPAGWFPSSNSVPVEKKANQSIFNRAQKTHKYHHQQ